MRDKRVRRTPVVDRDDRLSLLEKEMTELAKLVSHERQREAASRA